MRSQVKAPSAGSIWIATAMAAFAGALLVLTFAASPAFAVYFANTEPATDVHTDSAVLNGNFGNGGGEAHYYFEWGLTTAYGNTTPLPPGAGTPGVPGGAANVPPVTISGLTGGTTYHYRIVASDSESTFEGGDATFTTPSVDNLSADAPTAVTDTSAELNASFDGDGVNATDYYFEWGQSTSYGNATPAPPGNSIPASSGRVLVPPITIGGLESGVAYHYRVVATNALGKAVSADATFSTAEAPIVANVRSANVKATSAELLGEINPRAGQTSYRFEWGPTATYGNSTPVPAGEIGGGNTGIPVSVQLDGLTDGLTYHFRLVATNPYGTTTSPDQTFGFYPPPCPNSQLRQETRSNDLPDCRAYELVSPSFAQGTTLMTASGPVSGLATSPSRIAYGATWGVFPETAGEAMASYNDLYVSTRTDIGWIQRYVGLPPTKGVAAGGPPGGAITDPFLTNIQAMRNGSQATSSLDRVIDYNLGYPSQDGQAGVPSNAPYVWDTSNGTLLDRWPSNLGQVPGGELFIGIPQASTDFTHLVFTSNVVFASGGQASAGENKCCSGGFTADEYWTRASVYDNDLETGAVVLASRKSAAQGDAPFQGRVFSVSEDGSHILMAEEAVLGADNPFALFNAPLVTGRAAMEAETTGPLYLRVDATKTYEIAAGHKLRYAGSTADGAIVYLTSSEQLTADDHDSSRDLFVWRESEPGSLTRVSAGNHDDAGDTDACSPAEGWTSACGVSAIWQLGGNGHSDTSLASKSGDVYFESPELLVGQKGEAGGRNLYLYRAGALRFVATLRPNAPISRMQVTPDGSYMALITGGAPTGFGSGGMFLYDREAGRMTCASCRPDGQPLASGAQASQNGLFLSFDGRAFFSTQDPLVSRDTNEAIDVYEFTEGKAQLITTGLGPALSGVALSEQGLVGVSANGIDVYFSTVDNLVTQDHNAAQIKIYDARTGGGFPAEREEPKCMAADECHGPSSNQPPPLADRTSAALGTTPKAKPRKAKKHKAKKHKKAHKKKRADKAKRKSSSGKQGGKNHG